MSRFSPVKRILHHVAASPFRIAPEAAELLDQEIATIGVTLQYVDDNPKKWAEYEPSTRIVRLGSVFLDALWAASHLYLVAFRGYQEAQRSGMAVFAFEDDPRVAAAYVLYQDRLGALAEKKLVDWPDHAARPIPNPYRHTDGFGSNENFLVAVGWVIHHELAHAALGHQEASPDAMREERDADRRATAWVSNSRADEQERFKRALGIATAVVFLVAIDLRLNKRVSIEHPPSFERLIDALDGTGIGENHTVWAYAFVMLEVHLMVAKVPGDAARDGTFRDMCVSACMLLRGVQIW